ncbi:hypothetical protein AJ80_01230 [Polytolypa hystricis UAMH7299]|uniref:NADH-ubiquinone oxidoreductase 299 kDa subunit n=1 Tax=Polytolypa hystricis (strain UAMH7299) TaxID=1447883 RepID=A0A2B7Z0C3_POLH7|nr:hypothetical protein AJ80_01230 [Polytolypa hystricis UAMH7299]
MRATLRLFASVKPARYLEPFTPTGITGLTTHPSPRPTLIYLYTTTLGKLKQLPESSVYRKSTEALTQRRLKVIQSVKPPGYEAWLERVKTAVAQDPERFKSVARLDGTFAAYQADEPIDPEDAGWEGVNFNPQLEGPYLTEGQMNERVAEIESSLERSDLADPHWEAEPPLEAAQISDIENQLAAGLIEEVIQVAEGELKLVYTMLESKVWEELEEKPKPGQWTYFERGTPSS